VKIINILVATALVSGAYALGAFPASAQSHDCGKVTLANMNWSSATFIANLDRFILEHAYGCDAELIPGDTVPTGTSMIEKGEPDIASELWTNSFRDALDAGVKEGRLVVAGKSLSDGGQEAFWVPRYLVEKHPELATIQGVIKNASLFRNPEDPTQSVLMGCPSGWACQISVENMAKAMKLGDAGFIVRDPGSSAGLSGSLTRAYEREKPWVGYYWAPTALLGKFDMVEVDFGSGIDLDGYVNCITQVDCENPQPTMFPPAPVLTVAVSDLARRAPAAVDYLSKRTFTNAFLNGLLAWMEENQADGEIAAVHFLNENEDVWLPWVTDEEAGRIKSALASL
jgi:glycine betaine/proline transport system substrate-binding protein